MSYTPTCSRPDCTEWVESERHHECRAHVIESQRGAEPEAAPAPTPEKLPDFLPTGRFAALRVSNVVSAHVSGKRLCLVESDRESVVEVALGYERAWIERLGFACRAEEIYG